MRPLKLVLSAFGPYKEKVEIDFTKLGEQGIFLITGDTGAGKTTIFDGISFALFGISSGSRREFSSFRSDFAIDDVDTYVDFEFLHKGIVYKINRVPRYMRKKKKGNGMTSVGGEATLIFLDEVISGEKNVTEKCIDILGINANQFKQIVMIAQGEFLELLLAKPKDRASIFRHIFDTTIYKNISDRLKESYLLKKREYEDCFLSIKGYVEGIMLDLELIGNESTYEVLKLLEKEIIKDEELEKVIEKEKKELYDRNSKLIKEISEGKVLNDSIYSLKSFQERLDILLKDEFDILNKKDILNKNKDIWENIMPKYLELDKLRNDYLEKLEKLKINKEELELFLSKYNKISLKYKQQEEKFSKISDYKYTINIFMEKLDLLKRLSILNKELEDNRLKICYYDLIDKRNILSLVDKYQLELKNIGELRNKLILEKDIYLKRYEEYIKNYDKFLSAQAGILASTLKDGDVCPVCGSKEHPCLASIIEDIFSKEVLEEEKENVDKLFDNVQQISLELVKRENELSFLEKDVKDIDVKRLLEEISVLEDNCKEVNIDDYDKEYFLERRKELEIEIDNITKKFSDDAIDDELETKIKIDDIEDDVKILENKYKLEESIKRINDDISKINLEYNTIKKEYYDAIEKKSKLESSIDFLENDCKKYILDIEILEKEYVKSYQDLGYLSDKDYLNVKINKENLIELEEFVNNYQKEVVDIKGKILTLEGVIKKRKVVILDSLEDELNDINKRLEDIDLSLKVINNKISNNKKIFVSLKDVFEKIDKLEKEVMVYKDLSDTANGTISGKNKFEFEQYVQASYFDQVLVAANKRFLYMTDERYLLKRKEESVKISDKLGLELEVMDYYTGKVRDIKSLSGGESFKASLALALGMSDTIQEFAGGVVVDAMFIDEGFGSLDDDSLDQAMNAIMVLGEENRLIGIISHVNELKSRIDKKIVVNKTNQGSSIKIVI